MLLGKVVGTVVATRKDPGVHAFKFMLVRSVDPVTGQEGGLVVAADAVGVGRDELVLYATGSAARQTVMTKDRPCDAVIMAVVDQWEVEGEQLYEKHSSESGIWDNG